MSKRRRRYSEAFKQSVVSRMETTTDVQALALELGINRGMLYVWHRARSPRGSSALPMPDLGPDRNPGPPVPRAADTDGARPGSDPAAAQRRIQELERKIGQQQLALDFFRAALRHVRVRQPASDASGETGSTQ